MKKYLIFAASALALTSCSSDDFLGENPGTVQNATTAINFGGDAGKITRATSNEGDDHVKLDNQFKVYGVKITNGTISHNVFVNYSVWYNENLTTSNTNKWEYVGNNQTIKYWDYSATEYRFVAGSPIAAFNYNTTWNETTGTHITDVDVTGLAGHINANESGPAIVTNPVYVAEPKIVKKEDYKKPVQFNFIRQQSMVRVGLYETIPGYSITDIKFYEEGATTATSNNVILTSATADYFVGGKNVKGTVNYNWTTENPTYTYKYKDTDLTKSKNWYAGKFEPDNALATKSAETDVAKLYGTDQDMNIENGYFTVLPTPSDAVAKAILIKCDYTLTSDDGYGETIHVKGATAAIPAAFSKWDVNTRYTYLFKISQDTNGNTGDPDKVGLYPITFDAVVTEATDKTQGTTTTVATPSITTYQEGSVTENSIEYKTGKPIYATVANETDGTLNELNTDGTVGNVQVYKLSKVRTEADLQIEAIANTEFNVTNKIDTKVPTSELTVGIGKLDAKKYLTFTPNEEGWYAIQYKYAADTYKYKVIKVVAPTVAP